MRAITIELKNELYDQLEQAAEKKGLSVKKYIEDLLLLDVDELIRRFSWLGELQMLELASMERLMIANRMFHDVGASLLDCLTGEPDNDCDDGDVLIEFVVDEDDMFDEDVYSEGFDEDVDAIFDDDEGEWLNLLPEGMAIGDG